MCISRPAAKRKGLRSSEVDAPDVTEIFEVPDEIAEDPEVIVQFEDPEVISEFEDPDVTIESEGPGVIIQSEDPDVQSFLFVRRNK